MGNKYVKNMMALQGLERDDKQAATWLMADICDALDRDPLAMQPFPTTDVLAGKPIYGYCDDVEEPTDRHSFVNFVKHSLSSN